MAKENFDRSKPHVNIGAPNTDVGFVFTDGTLQIVNIEDANGDGFVSVNLQPNHKALIADDGGPLAGHESTVSPDQFRWTAFAQPILETEDGTPLPLLTTIDLARVGDDVPDFQIGQTLQVSDGAIAEWAPLSVHDGTTLSSLIGDPLNRPTEYSGTARVVGFVDYLIPEPTSMLLMAATAVAAIGTRRGRRSTSRGSR